MGFKKGDKTNTEKLLEYKFGKEIYELLRYDYLEEKMSVLELATKYGISTPTAHGYLVKYQIPRRKLKFI